ncbi:MAG TPA: sigma-70 family RNA polymerase sigma factor [Methylomirabilota bacterium]|jgi:RNA polymerase sigma factor (sigma-70 family)|nr:sigma-70 family RNA polymerase sigma factor [Methylomirabilota bacterium]
MTAETTCFPWNIVLKDAELTAAAQQQLRRKLAPLARLLQGFPPDAVHLQIVVERLLRPPRFRAALTLRVPSHIVHGEKTAPDLFSAVTRALAVLQREVQSLKARLAQSPLWKRKQSRAQLRQAKAVGFAPAPLAAGVGPQTLRDIVSTFLQQQYGRLLHHVQRHVRHDELSGELPQGAIDPRSVVDEVALHVLAAPQQKPEMMGWLVWIYHLIHEELRRRRRRIRRQAAEEVRGEDSSVVANNAAALAGDFEQPLTFVQAALEPPEAEPAELEPEAATDSPEQTVTAKELLEHLQQAIQTWPQQEREVFELYFVEGFEPDDIAMITGKPPQKIRAVITTLQDRLRQELFDASTARIG